MYDDVKERFKDLLSMPVIPLDCSIQSDIHDGGQVVGPGLHIGCVVEDGGVLELEEGAAAVYVRVASGTKAHLGKNAKAIASVLQGEITVAENAGIQLCVCLGSSTVSLAKDAKMANTKCFSGKITLDQEARCLMVRVLEGGSLEMRSGSTLANAIIGHNTMRIGNGAFVSTGIYRAFNSFRESAIPLEPGGTSNIRTFIAAGIDMYKTNYDVCRWKGSPSARNTIIADDAVLCTYSPTTPTCAKELIMQRGARILMSRKPNGRSPDTLLSRLHMAPGAALYIMPDVEFYGDTFRLGKNAVLQAVGSSNRVIYHDITLADNGILVI
jgi:hypothetical protein